MAETQPAMGNGRSTASAVPVPRVITTPGIHVTNEMVTPERARQLLGKSRNPRPLSKTVVANYADQMLHGMWDYNGDPIRVNSDDELIDGQHRLNAIIQSGKAQKMLIIHGLPNDVFKTVDVGKKRSAGDLLAIEGHAYYVNAAAVARSLLIYDSGVYWAAEAARKIDYKPSPKAIVEYVEKNPDVMENMSRIFGTKHNKGIVRLAGPTPIGMAYTLARRVNEKKADDFLDGVSGEVSTTKTDPRWVVRDFLMRQKIESRGLRRLEGKYTQAVMINAANLYFAGLEANVGLIRWRPENQWFPRFDGGKSAVRKLTRRESATLRKLRKDAGR